MMMLLVLALGIISLVSGATTSEFYEGEAEPHLCRVHSNGTENWLDKANEFDLFNDNFQVGDAFYIDSSDIYTQGQNQYTGVIMNVTTAMSADSYELGYEYKDGSGNWVNLSDVGDDTEMFSKTGQLRIGWKGVYSRVENHCGRNYYWWRIIVREVTNPTEGGYIGNGEDKDGMYFSPSSSMNVTTGSGTLNDLVNDDQGVTRYLINNRTAGIAMNLSLQIQSPANKPIPITFTTASAGAWDINITYEDGDGNSYLMNNSGNGNGTALTYPFFAITNIDTVGIGELTVEQDRWGCIDRSAHFPRKTTEPHEYFMLNCALNIAPSVSVDFSEQVLMQRGVRIAPYGTHNIFGGGYKIHVKGTLKCGSQSGDYGTNTGYLLTPEWVGWNSIVVRPGGLLNMSACVLGDYDMGTTTDGGNVGVDIRADSNVQFRDAFLSGGSRLRLYGDVISAIRLMLVDWRRIETYNTGKIFRDLFLLGDTGDSWFFAMADSDYVYDGYMYDAYAYSGDLYLIDSVTTDPPNARTIYTTYIRHRLNLTFVDNVGRPISGVIVNLYNKDNALADGSVAFPITSDSSGVVYSEVTKGLVNATGTYDFSNFTLTASKDGFNDVKVEGIKLADKTSMEITMNGAGIYPNINSLEDEYR